MQKVIRWVGRGLLAGFLLLLLAAGVVYAVSQRQMSRTYDVPVAAIPIPGDSASIAEGERLARTRGCYNGCHGEMAEGDPSFVDEPMLARIQTPDLTRAVRMMTDEELVRVIRHGVRPNGRSVFVMPSIDFFHLTDDDLGKIIAFLRSLPPTDGAETSVALGPMGRLLFAMGQFEPAAQAIDHDAARLDPGDGSDQMALGRYIATTSCAECHGQNFEGTEGPPEKTPNLAIAAAYTPDEFRVLMSTGEPRDGRQLRLMDQMSLKRYSHLTDAEIDATHLFLSRGLGTRATSAE